MKSDLVDLIQAIVRDELQGYRTAELGVVTAVYSHENGTDKHNYECDVRLRDSGLELKRLAVCTQRVGAVAIPNPDDLVLVQYLNGDIHAGVIVGRLYNDKVRPPEAKAREYVYISQDGAESGIRRMYIELPNNNTLTVDDDKLLLEMGPTKITINNDGDISLNCAGNNIKIADGNGTNLVEIQSGGGQVMVKGQTKAVVEAPQIELVENATHPVVFGDALVQYLTQLATLYQTHLHPGQMALGAFPVTPAPPVPPIQPPTPDVLSVKVKTG
jgi:phage baseplate assembly protein gpV